MRFVSRGLLLSCAAAAAMIGAAPVAPTAHPEVTAVRLAAYAVFAPQERADAPATNAPPLPMRPSRRERRW